MRRSHFRQADRFRTCEARAGRARVADESAACWAFETTVAVTGNNTGIVVREKAIEQLAAGNRPPVLVTVNGFEYRNTIDNADATPAPPWTGGLRGQAHQ